MTDTRPPAASSLVPILLKAVRHWIMIAEWHRKRRLEWRPPVIMPMLPEHKPNPTTTHCRTSHLDASRSISPPDLAMPDNHVPRPGSRQHVLL